MQSGCGVHLTWNEDVDLGLQLDWFVIKRHGVKVTVAGDFLSGTLHFPGIS